MSRTYAISPALISKLDRFDCLVQHDGLFDMRSFYYATEELWFPKWDFGGSYAEAKDTYERWNPVNHVDKWKTPMLVITGEIELHLADEIHPMSEGDCIEYASSTPHRTVNRGASVAIVQWIISPPTGSVAKA